MATSGRNRRSAKARKYGHASIQTRTFFRFCVKL
jgi:hypothetical protein